MSTAERNRRSSGSQQELKKGVTYGSSGGLENINMNNTTTIPCPTNLPEIDMLKYIHSCTVCFFDLETADLSDDIEIAQVSAVDFESLKWFE